MKKYVLFESVIKDDRPMIREEILYLHENDTALIQTLGRLADKSGNLFAEYEHRDEILEGIKSGCAEYGIALQKLETEQ